MRYQTDFYSNRHNLTLSSAKETLKVFLKTYKPRSAVDVDCGVGTWLEVLKESGCKDVLGIDSSDVPARYLRLKNNEFLVKNLEKPFNVNRRYDLAISLEVAEHLTPKSGHSLVKSLCGLSDVVLFSAAIPGQGGVNHVNEQWQGYWKNLFLNEGHICFDLLRPKIWNNRKIYYWYRQNTIIYVRKNTKFARYISRKYKIDFSLPVNLVHPESYMLMKGSLATSTMKNKIVNLFRIIKKQL